MLEKETAGNLYEALLEFYYYGLLGHFKGFRLLATKFKDY